MADFEYVSVYKALQSLLPEIERARKRAIARAVDAVLGMYYQLEDLARDPANADLIPVVEKIRNDYERIYG